MGGERDRLAEVFAGIVMRAARPVMEAYATGCRARLKADASPVTAADEKAEAVILEDLAAALPGVPVVAEERCALLGPPEVSGDFILVDPLDGTREFLDHNGEFAVSIALVSGGTPQAGAVFAPAMGRLWFSGTRARTAQVDASEPTPRADACRAIATRPAPADGLVALVSRSHLDGASRMMLDGLDVRDRRPCGSALKFCLIAEGEADVYPRFSPTMAWDTAGGQAVLCAAGGAVLDVAGAPLRYGEGRPLRNGGFIAWGRAPVPGVGR